MVEVRRGGYNVPALFWGLGENGVAISPYSTQSQPLVLDLFVGGSFSCRYILYNLVTLFVYKALYRNKTVTFRCF
jgi:hypothetical protein